MDINSDNCGVKYVAELWKTLQNEIENDDKIIVDLNNVKSIDLSIVQLIVAAVRAAAKRDKTFRLKGVSEEVKQQMLMCGVKF